MRKDQSLIASTFQEIKKQREEKPCLVVVEVVLYQSTASSQNLSAALLSRLDARETSDA